MIGRWRRGLAEQLAELTDRQSVSQAPLIGSSAAAAAGRAQRRVGQRRIGRHGIPASTGVATPDHGGLDRAWYSHRRRGHHRPRLQIWYGSVLRADDDEIFIGEQCNIQDLCCLHVDAGEPAGGAGVSLGHHATVHGAHMRTGALVGIGAVVLGGAQVGRASLIAAGAVVLPGHDIPAGVLFAGVPGRVVRELPAPIASGSPTPGKAT